jgi:hypothetical protein
MKRRHLLTSLAAGSLAPLSSSRAEDADEKPHPAPPSYPIHGLDLQMLTGPEGRFLVRWRNHAGPEIKIWDERWGPGTRSYRIEFRDPATGTHYLILPALANPNFNHASIRVMAPGSGHEFTANIHERESWIWPEGLPHWPKGWEARIWYHPPPDSVGQWENSSQVTLDTFVGDWVKIP